MCTGNYNPFRVVYQGKWSLLDELTEEEKSLTKFEPEETITIKGVSFRVACIQLRPAQIILVPTVKRTATCTPCNSGLVADTPGNHNW